MMSGLSLSLLISLAFTISISEADYEFTVHFYEFRNPLGLQCGECGSGPPACCDDVQRNESCINVAPFTCDTRFRFLLRQFGASVETAPDTGFPHFTPSNAGNSMTFNEAPGGFAALANPFTITNTSEWSGSIQFFIDALDRAVSSNLSETEAIINRFPIDLELELGAAFTKRTTHTGIYNISGLGFDMSFRVQCSENYYGPNCATAAFCEGVPTCASEGIFTCLGGNQNFTFCTQCISSRNPSLSCAMCLDPSTNCTTCRSRNYDPSSNCTACLSFLDPLTNCTKCLPGFIQMGSSCTRRVESTEEPITTEMVDLIDHTDGGLNLALVGGVVGGGLAALIVIIILILCILKVVIQKRKKTKHDTSDAASCLDVAESFTYTKKTASGCSSVPQHDFNNPLYGPASAPPATTGATSPDEKYPMEQLLEVPNPYYGEVSDSASREGGSKQGSQTSLDKDAPRSRLATFPYVMDGAENAVSNASTTCTPRHQQQRERVEHVVYETTDNIASGKSTKIENGMYDTADNVCGKPAKAEDGMYDTADNVCGKPMGTEGGKKEIAGVVPQGEEHYDDIKTGGATAATYDDVIVPDKKSSAGVKVSSGTASAAVYDDILTSNTSTLYDDIQMAGIQALYDDVIKTTKLPSAVSVPAVGGSASDEYDDVVKGPASGAAAKPNNNFSEGEQPFDNEVYSAPYTTIPANPGPNFANDSTYMNSS